MSTKLSFFGLPIAIIASLYFSAPGQLSAQKSPEDSAHRDKAPIAYWNFDACNADDSSPNKNHGAIQGNPECVEGARGKALRFDGVDDYILVPNAESLNPVEELSLAAWYRPTRSFAGNGDNAILQKPYPVHESPYYQYHLGVNGDAYWPSRIPRTQGQFDARVAVQGTSVLQSTGNDFWKPGQWYCLVSTYNQKALSLFVDGKLIGQVNHPGPVNAYPTPLTIAKSYNINRPEVDYTPGDMDEVQIYNRALPEPEIRQICDNSHLAKVERMSGAMPPLTPGPEATRTKPPDRPGLVLDEDAALTAVNSQLARREGQTLLLRLQDGGSHNLKNRGESSEEGWRSYYFQAYMPDQHAYLIWISEIEWDGFLLVDAITGAETEIWGVPVISPDRKRFVAASLDLEAAFVANGVQIWKDQDGRFVSEYAKEYSDWGPSDVKWIDNGTIGITMNIPDTKSGGNYLEAIAYLKFDGKGRWLLDDSAKGRWERIVTGSGVRLRATPDTASVVVARLALGTVLTVNQRSLDRDESDNLGYWYSVETPDHVQGWVAGSQTLLFDTDRPEIAYREILEQRSNVLGPRKLLLELDFLMFLARILPDIAKADVDKVLPVLEQMKTGWDALCHAGTEGPAAMDTPYLLARLDAARHSAAGDSTRQNTLDRIELLIKQCAPPVPAAGLESGNRSAIVPDMASRAQIADGLSLAESAKTAVAEYYLSTGRFPIDNEAAGLPKPEYLIGTYVRAILVEDGAIHIAFGNRVDKAAFGKSLSLRPAIVTANPGSPISWVCGYASPVNGMTAQGKNKTSVPAIYLPASCRPLKAF